MSLPRKPRRRLPQHKEATDRQAEVGDRYRRKRFVNRVREVMRHKKKNSKDKKK